MLMRDWFEILMLIVHLQYSIVLYNIDYSWFNWHQCESNPVTVGFGQHTFWWEGSWLIDSGCQFWIWSAHIGETDMVDRFWVKIEQFAKTGSFLWCCRSVQPNWIFPSPSRCKSPRNSRQMETGKYKIPGKQKGNEIPRSQVARKKPQTQFNPNPNLHKWHNSHSKTSKLNQPINIYFQEHTIRSYFSVTFMVFFFQLGGGFHRCHRCLSIFGVGPH